MASAVSQNEKVRILEELVSNTAADKNFAIKVLTGKLNIIYIYIFIIIIYYILYYYYYYFRGFHKVLRV